MHPAQKNFCEKIAKQLPDYFNGKDVIDVGSMDINGNNRYLFNNCSYTGVDIGPGNNVDVVTPVHKIFEIHSDYKEKFDTVISTEMLEHDKYWDMSITAMTKLLKPGGLLIITAAGPKRPEHGTKRTSVRASPLTTDYYLNISKAMLIGQINKLKMHEELHCEYADQGRDIQFYCIKRK